MNPGTRVDDLRPFLCGVADWLDARVAADGSAVCPRHRIEHTGKLVYSAALERVLLRADTERAADAGGAGIAGSAGNAGNAGGAEGDALAERRRQRIRRRVLRTLSMARVDPASGATLFFPGSMDPRNAAPNLIDSGACCDVLAEVLSTLPELFTREEREQLTDTLVRVCASTLADAVLVKEVPAQRLWGATGLASVARLTGEARFAEAAREALRRAVAQAHPDGSMPYFPNPERVGEHPGVADVTTYYHSRHIGFIAHVLVTLGEAAEPEVAGFLRRALDLLCALQDRRGLKPLAVEAKQWYWESAYEVASHSFDAHALLEGARLFREPAYAAAGQRALDRLVEHAHDDGGVLSHRGPGLNFQCRDFWNGHVAWVARAWEQRRADGDAAVPTDAAPVEGVTLFADAGLVRVDRPDYALLLRGAKQPMNISFGGEVGGGSLVWFGRRERGFLDEVRIPKWAALTPGDWMIVPRGRPGLRARWRGIWPANRRDARFRLYIADVERRAGNWRHALGYPWRHVVAKFRDELRWRFAVHLDTRPELELEGEVLTVTARPCRRDGTPLPGVVLHRRLVFGATDVEVDERLELAAPVREVHFWQPAAAREVTWTTDAPRRARGQRVVLRPHGTPTTVGVRYRL